MLQDAGAARPTRSLGDRAIEPPAAAGRWADSLRTEHHAQLKEFLRAVGCCDGREEGMLAETTSRRFPPPWTVEETAPCFIVRDANGQALAFVYCENEPGATRDGRAADPR